ncbi:hypothetical protein DFP72DRAFT_839534 [Ephemerocybe angulata]|uniref:Uncharacterized protein n=1 Tax=Ephemerocybe angulata TaxID=980116 RepID=A0A8H6IKM2_9AGAR|nr:hypothetical protein DFP72DRAFT_839534 [Tulosesus angulatus]
MSKSPPTVDKLGPFPFHLARKSHLLTPGSRVSHSPFPVPAPQPPTLDLPKHPLLDGKPIHMRRKNYLKESLLVKPDSEGDVAPELESSSYASTSKEVLVLFAPPPRTSQVHPAPVTAAEENTVKFTEGTEANKAAPIPDGPINKARVILPLPKRSLRQSARLTARLQVAQIAPKADCMASAPPAPKGKAQSDEDSENDNHSTRSKSSWRIVKFA